MIIVTSRHLSGRLGGLYHGGSDDIGMRSSNAFLG